jgi:hypothetical protein
MTQEQFEQVQALVSETLSDSPDTVTQVMDLLDARVVPLVQSWVKVEDNKVVIYRSSITGEFISAEAAKADPEHSVKETI